MTNAPLERKLAAILYADVAGYSRLTGEDEDGTHLALRAYLDAITSQIQRCDGRVVHYAGDAILAEFSTATSALSCAVDVQQDLQTRNQDLPEERKVQFRIGVNLGEVIVDQNEIYGDGVNVAARLESLAEPGGVTVSESVRTAIGNKLPVGYEFMGEQRVKNIAEPVRAYRVQPEGETASNAAPRTRPGRRKTVTITLVILALCIAGGVIAWLEPWATFVKPDTRELAALPLQEKPSIAVLPFTNISGDPEQEYFSDGMTDDLITDLSKLSGLFVIARNSVFTYKGKAVTISQVANELGVRYVLEGSVRRAGDTVRINAKLIDGQTGGNLWAERYDGSFNDVFSLQDQVTRRIVAALKLQLTPQEEVMAADKGTDSVAAYDAFLRGWELLLRKTPEDAIKAIDQFDQATKLDPEYARAYAALAQTYWENSLDAKFNRLTGSLQLWGGEGYMNDVTAWKFLQKVGDKPVSLAHALAAQMLQRQRRFDEATARARQAVALSPSNPIAYDALIEILVYAGESQEALRLVDESIGLDPSLPGEKLFLRGLAYYTMGRLSEALSAP